MCGIAGVIQYESEIPRGVRQRALKILLTEMMLKTEARGRDATGLYQVMADGDWLMTKKAQKAESWLFQDRDAGDCKDPYVYRDIVESWAEHDRELEAVIGHCRAKTIGGVENENNHPFAIQVDERNALLGVHNGTLHNHEIIFKKLPDIVKRQGTVDSEAIFHLLYHLTDYGTKPITPEVIKTMGARLDGAYACVVVNTLFPNQVITFRQTRPLEFFIIWPLNVVLLASEKKIVEAALEKYHFIRRLMDPELPALAMEDRTLSDRDYRIFDTSKKFPTPRGIKMSWTDFDSISQAGEFQKFHAAVLADWKSSVGTTSTTKPTSYNAAGSKGTTQRPTGTGTGTLAGGGTGAGQGNTVPLAARTTKAPSTRAIPAKTGGSDEAIEVEGTVVEVEFGNEDEAKRAYEHAPSLGACVQYDKIQEIARAIGKTPNEVSTMSAIPLANAISRLQFTLGYAMGRVDSKGEIIGTRVKGKVLTKKLEELTEKLARAQEKLKRAQDHIWAYKALIQIMFSLASAGYPIRIEHIDSVLRAFQRPDFVLKNLSRLSEAKKREVLDTAKEILESKDTIDLVDELHDRFDRAEKRKKQRQGTA